MTTHTIHPSIREHGLQDDCPRCAEHAARPDDLDAGSLRAIVERTQAWMRDEEFPRSEAEKTAMRQIEHILTFARLFKRVGIVL